MFVAQMPISFHAQCATVLMSEPSGNGGNVHAGFNAARGKRMPQVVVGDAFHTGQLGGAVYGFLALENLHHGFLRQFIWTLRPDFFQQLPQAAVEWKPPGFAVFGDADVKQALLEIHVVPQNVPGLINSHAGEREESKQVGAILNRPFAFIDNA